MAVIYALRCPIAKTVRYVGKTDDLSARLRRHQRDADKFQHHRAKWLRLLHKQGQQPEPLVLLTVSGDLDWQVAERFMIAAARSLGFPLTNSTAGGEGTFTDCPDARARHAAAMSRIASNRMKDQSVRDGLSVIAKTYWQDDAAREWRAQATAAQMQNPAMRALCAEAARQQNADPTYQARRAEYWAQPSARQIAVDAAKRDWADPEKKAARVAALRAAWVRRKQRTAQT